MEYRNLGRTGVKVSSLALGTWMFGAMGNTDRDETARIIQRALDAGINLIDTADMYSRGESEEIVGAALAGGRRDDVLLATKFHHPMGESPNRRGNSRQWIMRAAEASLRRLRTDWIDLYQVHRPDPTTDIDETLGALSDLVREGKIRYAGTSTFPAHELVRAQWVAERRGHRRFVTEQPPYSILVRGVEREVLPACEQLGIGVFTYGPLASGWLSGRYRLGEAQPPSTRAQALPWRYDSSREQYGLKLAKAEALSRLADEAGLTLIELSIAFARTHRAVSSVIIGPRTLEHLDSQLAAIDLQLDDALLDRIDEVVPPGVNVDHLDVGYLPPALVDARLRRRSALTRPGEQPLQAHYQPARG